MLVSRDLKRNPQVVLGACFSSFCEWYLGFSGPEDDHGRARDQVDFLCGMDGGGVIFNFSSLFLLSILRVFRWLYLTVIASGGWMKFSNRCDSA